MIAPALALTGLIQILLGQPTNGYQGSPLANFILHQFGPAPDPQLAQNDLMNIAPGFMGGIGQALPALIGAALAAAVGRIFKA